MAEFNGHLRVAAAALDATTAPDDVYRLPLFRWEPETAVAELLAYARFVTAKGRNLARTEPA